VTWNDHGVNRQVELSDYRHLWRASRLVQTDWSGGSGQSVWDAATANKFWSKDSGADTATPGIVTLTAGFIDWTQATTTGTYNTSGNFDDEDVFEKDGKAYLVTDNNSSGNEFYILDVQNIQNPTLLGGLDIGSGVNAVVVYGNYAYLATDDNSKEIQIVNVSNPASPSLSPSPASASAAPAKGSASASTSPSSSLSPSLPADFAPFNFVTIPEILEDQPPYFRRNSLVVMENAIAGANNTYQRIPEWNISGRPETPKIGTIGFNIQTNCLEYWDGNRWLSLPMKKVTTQ
jgi:hypothetical protein